MGFEEDQDKCRIYAEFYERNKELFKEDLSEYWFQCRRYYEKTRNNERGIRKPVREGD